VDLTVAQESALAANLELARGAGSRYLVQRWGDGEVCDKTGKPREVEVQVRSTDIQLENI
jgi:protein OS-9